MIQLENRCNKVRRAYKGIDFRIISKHPSEWEEYISNICKIYGFKRKENPTSFTTGGRYVGGYEEMVQEMTKKFGADGVALDQADIVNPDVVFGLLQLNIRITNQDFTLRNKLESLCDRINSSYSNHLKQGSFNFHEEKYDVVDLDTRIVDFE